MSLIEDANHLRISFQEIIEATQNFTTLIGSGGYGPVYKGELSISGELSIVAVKRLHNDNISGQGLKEFLTEIHMLSRYKHQNIVSLVGFCEELKERFLIYKYAQHGSLNNYLKPKKSRCPLTWRQRVNICVDAARGLDHLHNHVATNQRVIHRDIKSANILLDHNWRAMIADFGLSKIGRANESVTYVITNPCGTYGYCDPAYINSGILTKECDVYSFGVVLFEVLCGRLCFENVNHVKEHLAPLAQRCYQQKKLNLIIDEDLKKYVNSYSMKVFSDIAFQCLQDDRKQRPSMSLVLQKLEKALEFIEIEDPPELLELEEELGVHRLVKALQIKHFQEACKMHQTEEAITLHIEDENEINISKVLNLSTSNGEWDNLLPSDYKQFIYYSNKEMMKKPQGDVIFPTKQKAYSTLSRGVLIKVNHEANMWFWITKLNGKKCFILPPTLLSFGKQCLTLRPTWHSYDKLPSMKSRIKSVLSLSLSKLVAMRIDVPYGLWSTNTTYGCYLVYKMPQDFVCETMFQIKFGYDSVVCGQHPGVIAYMSIPQNHVIGRDGALFEYPEPIDKPNTIQLPKKRKDGWLEMNLGYNSDIEWTNMQEDEWFDYFWQMGKSTWESWFLPSPPISTSTSVSYNESHKRADNIFTLDPRYFSSITIYMWPLYNSTKNPNLILQGVEFRPL